MTHIDLNFIEEKAIEAERLGIEWATYNQVYRRLDRGASSFFSQIKNKIAEDRDRDGFKVVESQLERLALAHPDYIAFMEKLVNAEAEALKAKVKYETARNLHEARRSYVSLEKTKMGLL